ncbi:hypothetical protein LAU42_09125 [Macrococcus armenti]|uniref:hypothetical protein n=1 Tax=Macrococcus armenti TaxID=2875764 RepID=UPI001CCDB491|nr:hypothetical protein [Macrococcus armenti]UBH21926.1 hypothetical protein LAU42_09125 [Macrococcus armenti]
MVNVTSGLDALNLLNDVESAAHENKFSKLGSGQTRTVKVLNWGDFIGVQTYSIFKQVNTFVPEVAPKLSAKGFPVDNLTPFDKAWQYWQDKSEKFGDEASQEATKYRIKPRFAVGFYDLDEKTCIVIDFSKNQAKDVLGIIQKNEKKLTKKAFELEKSGTGTSTKVVLSPLDLDDLTPEQETAFNEAPKEFDKTLFENLYFVQNEEQMVESLKGAGFDVSLIGLEGGTPVTADAETQEDDPTANF